jgi:hypothetical protein
MMNCLCELRIARRSEFNFKSKSYGCITIRYGLLPVHNTGGSRRIILFEILFEHFYVGHTIWIIGTSESNIINTVGVNMHGFAAFGAGRTIA